MVPSGNKECKQTAFQRETFNHILLTQEVTNRQHCSSVIHQNAVSGKPELCSHSFCVTGVSRWSYFLIFILAVLMPVVFLLDSSCLRGRLSLNRGAASLQAPELPLVMLWR